MAPLHRAASLGRKNLTKTLLRAGAAPEAKDNLGRTPLEVAHRAGHERVVEELRAAGAVDLVSSRRRF